MSSRFFSSRLLLVAGFVILGLSACGRRGAPEAPPDMSAPQGAVQPEAAPGTLPSPVGTPAKKVHGGYKIPDRSFILDPLL